MDITKPPHFTPFATFLSNLMSMGKGEHKFSGKMKLEEVISYRLPCRSVDHCLPLDLDRKLGPAVLLAISHRSHRGHFRLVKLFTVVGVTRR